MTAYTNAAQEHTEHRDPLMRLKTTQKRNKAFDFAAENEFWSSKDKKCIGSNNARLIHLTYRSRAPSRGVLVFVLFSVLLYVCEGVRPYGTDNGYDNEGGTEPICWDSKVRWEDAREPPNSTKVLNDNFDIMNGKLFANDSSADEVDVTLRTSCYEGMNLTVTPSIEKFDGRLMTGETYTFQFELQFVPSRVNENAFVAAITNKTTWMRLLLCDAVRTGFCSPFIEQGDIETSEKTDLEGPMLFDTGEADRYGYEENRTLMGVTYGLHLFTRFARWSLNEMEAGLYKVETTVDFQVPKGEGGFYFFLGHAIIYFDVQNNTTPYQFRIDIADAAPNNVVEFVEPPQINVITEEFKLAVAVICGLLGIGEIYFLLSVIWYRKNPVMQLAQAPFLALLVVCGMIVTATVFVFMPTRDVYCNLRGVLVLIPLTLMASILIGRLWRVYSTLKIALTIGDQQNGRRKKRDFGGQRIMDFLSGLASVHTLFRGEYTGSRRHSLRKKISDGDLLRVLCLLTLPQIILQIVGVSLYQREIVILFPGEGDIGRTMCDLSTRWPDLAGEIYIGLLFVMAIIVAYASRDLPSVFNEKTAIFMSASMNGVVVFFVLAMIFIFEESILEPNVTAFLWIFMTLFLVVSTLCMIVMPKIRRVRSGEKLVMSKLLDPAQSRRQSLVTSPVKNGMLPAGQGMSDDPEGALTASDQTVIANNCAPFPPPIVLNFNDPPPRRIERQLFSLKDLCAEFTNDSLEGRHITLSLWKTIISAIDNLNRDLQSIDFTWNERMEELENSMAEST